MDAPAEAEGLIQRLVGVRSARVEWISDVEASRVHVLSDGQRSARSLAREVHGLLELQCGVRVAPEEINVVEVATGLGGGGGRPRLVGCEWLSDLEGIEVRCRLEDGGSVVEGAGRGRRPEAAAAQAAVAAVNQLTGGVLDLSVGDLQVLETVRGAVVVAVVDLGAGDVLSGSALVGERDLVEAACRATLDAINRQLVRRRGAVRTGEIAERRH